MTLCLSLHSLPLDYHSNGKRYPSRSDVCVCMCIQHRNELSPCSPKPQIIDKCAIVWGHGNKDLRAKRVRKSVSSEVCGDKAVEHQPLTRLLPTSCQPGSDSVSPSFSQSALSTYPQQVKFGNILVYDHTRQTHAHKHINTHTHTLTNTLGQPYERRWMRSTHLHHIPRSLSKGPW